MTKNKQNKRAVHVKKPKAPKQKTRMRNGPGAVSTISTAPVAIGNSITGSESSVKNTANGIIVRGRDFMFTPINTALTTWTCVGGTALTPAAFADTTLANYMRVFAKFRFKALMMHYITSSATSSAGDIMMYHAKNRHSVFLNQSSPQLLGFVLSDPDTVIGPQWTNHSALMKVTGNWKSTDYGMNDCIDDFSDGEFFLMAKTAVNSSPGYVLFDYVIEFAEHQLQPRLLSFPVPRIQYYQTNIGLTAKDVTTALAKNTASGTYSLIVKGNNLSGTTAALPNGVELGDIYKIFIDVTNSVAGSWTACTAADVFLMNIGTGGLAIPLSDGFTCYAVVTNTTSGVIALYQNVTAAYAASAHDAFYFGVSATITFNLQVYMSYVGSLTNRNLIPNF